MSYPALLEEWHALLGRRPTFREPLAPYEPILAAWAQWPEGRTDPLRWSVDACLDRWQRGVPLLSEAAPTLANQEIEELLGPAMDAVAAITEEHSALRRLAEAWDRGEVTPSALFPGRGRIGSVSVQEGTGLSQESLAFLASASLRPILDQYFVECRPHLASRAWEFGICPFCGAPPAFADILEDGQRRLACHLCGAGWSFTRLRCPYCGSRDAKDLVRMLAEEKEEGYAVFACKACRGYLKELDRRIRWNAGSALVEDWGSPHLDLVAHRSGYWRAVATLIELERAE